MSLETRQTITWVLAVAAFIALSLLYTKNWMLEHAGCKYETLITGEAVVIFKDCPKDLNK